MPPKGAKVGVRKLSPKTPELQAAITKYFHQGMYDQQIIEMLFQKHLNRAEYSMSVQSLRAYRRGWGLERSRSQGHTVDNVGEIMDAHRDRHSNTGAVSAMNLIRTETGGSVLVPRSVVREYNQIHEPEKVAARLHRVTPKKPFVVAGPNEMWAVDQHDKFKKWGLWFHACVDTYSGFIIWLTVWWTNSNPRLIASYFLDAILKPDTPRMPMLTQSDPGTENFGIANAQSTLRQMLDPSLVGTMQHIHSRKHGNIKPEILWRLFRERYAADLERLYSEGLEKGIFNPDINIENLVFRFIFMPLTQAELNIYTEFHNSTPRRANRKSVLPHAAPVRVYEYPEHYCTRDFKITVPAEAVEQVRQTYANPQDFVFEFLPPSFLTVVHHHYQALGGEAINRSNAWYYYLGITEGIRRSELSALAREQVLFQGNLYRALLEQSESGAARADAWGHSLTPLAPIEFCEERLGGMNDFDESGEVETVEMSGEEDVDDTNVELDAQDW
ncbi:hypothetical protein FRC07_012033 [Ceratobasidium sp. 392]|nr:hypothetical protein FRC07_012033 [Ceratobasidium sp. 392]